MQLIQTVTVASAQAEIQFNSIPQTFTDLYLVFSIRSAGGNEDIGLKINTSTADFTNRYLVGSGSAASSGTAYGNLAAAVPTNTWTASTFGNAALYIPNYRSNTAKSISVDSVSEQNATTARQLINAMLWNQTAAINSLRLYQLNGNDIAQFSSASLYGITAGSDGIVTVS